MVSGQWSVAADIQGFDKSDKGQITEWYINSASGIEHGFTLNNPPMELLNEEPLRVEIEFGGAFKVKANSDGKGVMLTSRDGVAVSYDKLKVIDATGRELALEMKVRGRQVSIEVADCEAQYPVTIDPVINAQVAKLQELLPLERIKSGTTVAISGNTAIVGTDRSRGAFIFERNAEGPNNWGQVLRLNAGDPFSSVAFGTSVAISGDTAIVGARGEFSNQGAAYIFERNQGGANNWGQVLNLKFSSSESGVQFGDSVSISGNVAIVGAPREDAGRDDAGAAYVYERNQGGANNWGEVRKLLASDREAGDAFGTSVSMSGNTAIVGSPGEDTGGEDAGAAYILERGNNWGEVRKIQASDRTIDDAFGTSVAISIDMVVVGAPGDVSSSTPGAMYLFERNQGGGNNWGEVRKLLSSDGEAGDRLGDSVAISGDTAIVGAPMEDTGGRFAGAAYVFGMNNPPVISTQPITVSRGTALTGAVLATVSDDITPASSLLVMVESSPAGITISNLVNANGVLTANVSASCSAKLGANTVVLSAMDAGGLITMANLSVTITPDNIPPVITCPGDITAVASSIGGTAIVDYPPPTATDNCGIQSIVCNPPSGSAFPLGVTTVTCIATDTAGNTASCSFTITVFDIRMQDDSVASKCLLWNSQTGDYRICYNGVTLGGRGTALRTGNIFKLTHSPADRRLTAQIDKGTNRGTASLQYPVGQNACSITDRDLSNDSCICQRP